MSSTELPTVDLSLPIALDPVPVPRVWGGRKLFESFHRTSSKPVPDGPVGESWGFSDYSDDRGMHSVLRGVTRTGGSPVTLRDVVSRDSKRATGKDHPAPLPLLFKFLDARDVLSVQLHPSDADCAREGLEGAGKSEAWIVIDAEPGARIVYGLEDGVTQDDYLALCRAGRGDEGLRWIEASRGDVFDVPPGTIHAIGGGILLAEIQQTSDTTYRLHDWGRVGLDGTPRTLHLGEAARVTPVAERISAPLESPAFRNDAFVARVEPGSRPFTLEELRSTGPADAEVPRRARGFGVLAVLDGEGWIDAESRDRVPLRTGDVFFWPAAAGPARVRSEAGTWVLWCEPNPGI